MDLNDLIGKSPADVDELLRQGRIDDQTHTDYCWLWRNSVARFTHVYAQFEGLPPPSAAAALLMAQLNPRYNPSLYTDAGQHNTVLRDRLNKE